MPTFSIAAALQVVVALGLLNVWILRSRSATSYRGGSAKTLKEEFAAYGLPEAVFYLVGALKITAALLLLVGLWIPVVVAPAAGLVALLMVGALAMHAKVKDPPVRSLPASAMLFLCLAAILF